MEKNMKKICLTVLIACLFLRPSAFADNSQQLTKISKNVYAYVNIKDATPAGNSYGANVGVVIGSNAVLVIDTLISANQAKELIYNIKKITDKPIKYAVNTHFHLDHAWGNSEFAKIGAKIIGSKDIPFTEEQVNQSMASPETFGLTPADLEGTFAKLPDIKVEKTYTVDLGDITVLIKALGHSHTQDSMTVLIKEDNILFTGDIIFNKYHAFIGDGDIKNWTAILKKLKETTATTIIPGHGPIATLDDINDMLVYINDFDIKATALCKGKTIEYAQAITEELSATLPSQGRDELPGIIGMNLHTKYLKSDK